ncbi:MAG: superoxide dismutase [Candidatus Absconditabacterales bacterium]
MFTLAPLPFDFKALEPIIDAQTVELHYTKHHQGYVNKLNELVADTGFKDWELEEIIKTSDGPIFNNAAQIWNHTFYRNGLIDHTRGGDGGFQKIKNSDLAKKIIEKWGSFEAFKGTMIASAVGNFGSGRTWLVQHTDGTLDIMNTSNAGGPLTHNKKALLAIDVREHAYYLKYQNRRIEYVTNIWKCINWDKVNEIFSQ